MRTIEKVRLVIGALLMAAALFALMSAPGFMSDLDSTAPLQELREALR